LLSKVVKNIESYQPARHEAILGCMFASPRSAARVSWQ